MPGQSQPPIEDTAVIVLLRASLRSALSTWYLYPSAGTPLVERVIQRARRTPGLAASPIYLACFEHDKFRHEFEKIALRLGCAILPTGDGSKLSALSALAAEPDVSPTDTIAVFEGDVPFPDCYLCGEMLACHRAKPPSLTVLDGGARGLAPEFYSAGAIGKLQELNLPEIANMDCAIVLKNLARIPHAAAEMPFSVAEFRLPRRLQAVITELPRRTSVTDGRSAKALELCTEELLNVPKDAILTDYPARRFKAHLQHTMTEPLRLTADLGSETRRIVLFATLADGFGGAEEALLLLITSLDRSRFRPVTVCPHESQLTRKLLARGYDIVIANSELASLTAGPFGAFSQIVDHFRPQIIHIDSFAIPALVALAASRGIALIQHVRNLYGSQVPDVFTLASKVLAVSNAVRADLMRGDIDPGRIRVVYDGVEAKDITPAAARQQARDRFGISPQSFVITMPARICAQKRQDLLAAAIARSSLLSGRGAVVLFVGEPLPSELRFYAELHAFAQQDRFCGMIRLAGFHEDMTPIYAASDAIVVCNAAEPLSLVVLEAMARGIPVVAPASAGPSELIINDSSGLLFGPGDPASLANALERLMSDRELCQRIANGGRLRAATFSLERYARSVEDVYEALG